MFNLEQAITEWRQKMLAEGIKTPVPLEELESHLRDDIERQAKSGLSEEDAFKVAVQQIGQPGVLKKEFSRAAGFLGWFGNDRSTRINRILGAAWMVQTLWSLISFLSAFLYYVIHQPPSLKVSPFFWLAALVQYSLLIFGSVYLYRGAELGRVIIKWLALLGACGVAIQAFRYGSISQWGIINTFFNLATVWFLRSPQKQKLASQ